VTKADTDTICIGYGRSSIAMAAADPHRTVEVLLRCYGKTYAEALSIDLARGTPSALFQWLCASLLFSARIRADAALEAARALFREGLTTAEKMASATWEERTRILNHAGYARYDESTSRMLGETSRMILDHYRGDLRNLREAASRDPQEERRLLEQFKGIGDVGADIFMREVQLVWDELFPFADRRALRAAQKLGLGADAQSLARRVKAAQFPRLVAALVRTDLGRHYEKILAGLRPDQDRDDADRRRRQ
jgi:endonuclease III